MYPRALGRSAAALGGVGMVSQILIISEMIRSGKGKRFRASGLIIIKSVIELLTYRYSYSGPIGGGSCVLQCSV